MEGLVSRIIVFFSVSVLSLIAFVRSGDYGTEARGKPGESSVPLYSAPSRTMILNRITLGDKATGYTAYTSIEVPGAFRVAATGNNDRGQIVGSYLDETGQHGYILENGQVTAVNIPGMFDTRMQDINNKGVMIGTCVDPNTAESRGFMLKGDTWIALPAGLEPLGLNENGAIVGCYFDDGKSHGFLLERGEIATIDYPGAENTWIEDINQRGQMVGFQGTFIWGAHSGFLLDNGVFTTIDPPEGVITELRGINSPGQILGVFDFDKGWRGFLLFRDQRIEGAFTLPGIRAEGLGTHADDVNDRGQIVGWYEDWFGTIHGFILE